MTDAFIVGAVRTAGGRKGGQLSGIDPSDLGAKVLDGLLGKVDVDPAAIEDVIFGCVSQVGSQSGNIGRTVVLASSLPESVPGTVVDRQCGSGQQAIHFAAQGVMSGTQDIVIGGGVESMTRVPIGASIVDGIKQGHGHPYEGEGLKTRYPGVKFSQFTGAELLAKKHNLTREDLDSFAFRSHNLAAAATKEGKFKEEIIPIDVEIEGEKSVADADEGIRYNASLEKMQSLQPLVEGGLITAALSSQICDGSAAVMIASEAAIKEHNLTARARIHTMTVIGSDPVIMLEGPIPAAQLALKKSGLKIEDMDVIEINEAFAPVPVAWYKALGADIDKLNVNGGAMALGHPLGATGAKLMATLLNELERRNGRYGMLAICEGGGTANCTIIERV